MYAAVKKERMEHFKAELSNLCDKLKLTNTHIYYLLAGNLNSRHTNYGDKKINAKGRALKNWEAINSAKYKLKIIPTLEPSYPRNKRFIDICMIDIRLNKQPNQ